MRAKEKLIAQANKLAYATDIKKNIIRFVTFAIGQRGNRGLL